jgi:hypothetical protein
MVMGNLKYSYIVASNKVDDKVLYFIIMLAATGEKAPTAFNLYSDYVESSRTGQMITQFTYDQTIDKHLHTLVVNKLAEVYGKCKFISIDGVIIDETDKDKLVHLAETVSVIAYNSLVTEKVTAKIGDMNIASALAKAGNAQFNISVTPYNGSVPDMIGKPHKAMFQLSLDMLNKSTVTSVHMAGNGQNNIIKVIGYIDCIPEEVNIPVAYGQPPVTKTRLHPHVIITDVVSKTPTVGMNMLAIATALVMEEPDVLYPVLIKDPNVGALNLITNIENGQNSGTILPLSNKKTSEAEAIAAVKEMFSLRPLFSFDIDAFGANSYTTSVLSTAASLTGSKASVGALNKIIQTVAQLTNGAFPKDFPISKIFANQATTLPSGYFLSETGKKDIREITTSFVANHTTDMMKINKYIVSELPKTLTGSDPYISKLELYQELIPDAVIETKTSRVMFSGEFMVTLLNSIKAVGFDPKYRPLMQYEANIGYGQMGGFINNAIIDNGASFGRVGVGGNQYNYNVPQYGGGMGYNRWQ